MDATRGEQREWELLGVNASGAKGVKKETHLASSRYPQCAAACSGVHPSRSHTFISAPRSSNHPTCSTLLSMHACPYCKHIQTIQIPTYLLGVHTWRNSILPFHSEQHSAAAAVIKWAFNIHSCWAFHSKTCIWANCWKIEEHRNAFLKNRHSICVIDFAS